MPPGYTAFFLWMAASILWWSGWRESSDERIPDAAIAAFLAGWPIAAWTEWPAWGETEINGAFVWTLVASAALLWRLKETRRWMAISAGFLVGSLEIVLTAAGIHGANLPEWFIGTGGAAAAGASVCILAGGGAGQAAGVTLALAVPELLGSFWQTGAEAAAIGSGSWAAAWWIAVITARLLSFAGAAVRMKRTKTVWRGEGGRT